MDSLVASFKSLLNGQSAVDQRFAGSDKTWLKRQALSLFFIAALLLLVFENSQLDLVLSRLVFDPVSRHFPGQQHWFFNDLMHHGLKTASYVLALPALALAFFCWRGRLSLMPPRNALLGMLGLTLIPLLSTLLKHLTNRHCPWDIVEFGGYAPYLSLFIGTPEHLIRGVCFPSGHASGGFAWVIWGLALRSTHPALAKKILYASFALGMVMGLSRLVQGAHFLSHVLWSAWFAWALAIALAALLRVPVVPERSAD